MRAIHKVTDIIRLGLHSLTVHKVRSALTALGILFGVWSVIAMLAVSEGASYESQLALRELGSDNIIIEAIKPPEVASSASAQQGRGATCYGLTNADVARLSDNIPGIELCVTVHRTLKYAQVGSRNLSVAVIATEPTYVQVARTEIVAGRFISAADVLRHKPYCVITASLARRIFTYADPLGKTLRLGSEPFTVIGILAQLPRTLAGGTGDVGNYVMIPISTDRTRFGEYTVMRSEGAFLAEKVQVSQIILRMADEQAVLQGTPIARNLLKRFHDKPDYHITVPLELIEQRKKQLRLWNFVFLSIASVSLLVGGIGIMNIMLAGVTERTREIGIRRAIGAKQRDITVQFLIEAVTLTTIGGLLGIVIGLLVPWAVQQFLGFMTIVTASTLLLPFVMAVVVGLISGLYPALRAARLDPIVALRHE